VDGRASTCGGEALHHPGGRPWPPPRYLPPCALCDFEAAAFEAAERFAAPLNPGPSSLADRAWGPAEHCANLDSHAPWPGGPASPRRGAHSDRGDNRSFRKGWVCAWERRRGTAPPVLAPMPPREQLAGPKTALPVVLLLRNSRLKRRRDAMGLPLPWPLAEAPATPLPTPAAAHVDPLSLPSSPLFPGLQCIHTEARRIQLPTMWSW